MSAGNRDPIVEVLARRRAELGLTVRDVGAAAGVWFAKISEWERGVHQPSVANLRKWADALGLDLAVTLR